MVAGLEEELGKCLLNKWENEYFFNFLKRGLENKCPVTKSMALISDNSSYIKHTKITWECQTIHI